MTNMLKATLVATLTAIAIASPASAQSSYPEGGYRNVSPLGYKPLVTYGRKAVARREGLRAYAMESSSRAIDSPALTGGGSLGYNESLRTNY